MDTSDGGASNGEESNVGEESNSGVRPSPPPSTNSTSTPTERRNTDTVPRSLLSKLASWVGLDIPDDTPKEESRGTPRDHTRRDEDVARDMSRDLHNLKTSDSDGSDADPLNAPTIEVCRASGLAVSVA